MSLPGTMLPVWAFAQIVRYWRYISHPRRNIKPASFDRQQTSGSKAAKLMYLKPAAYDGSFEPLSDAPAAGIRLSDGKLIVSSIDVNGPFEKPSLKLGDLVSAVDGQNVIRGV